MNSKTTWRLTVLALALFAFIYFFESKQAGSRTGSSPAVRILPGLEAAQISGLEISISNQVIRAERTNDSWRLTTPNYPAQVTALDRFASQVAELPRRGTVEPAQISSQGGLKVFGLDPPFATVTLRQGPDKLQLRLGNRAPLVNQLYLQLAGSDEVLMTDASFLAEIPRSANDWRSPMLLDLASLAYDRLQIRSGPGLFEFERDKTNKIWRITKPIPARADPNRIDLLLLQLREARVARFVTDQPGVDLERFGLQTPELEVSFAQDTNVVLALKFGGASTNDAGQVYALRSSNTNVVTVRRELTEFLRLPYKQYHDPRLISFAPAAIDRISIRAGETFSLARKTNQIYALEGPGAPPTDPELAAELLTNFFNLEIVDFAKDVPTEADLKDYKLTPPLAAFELYSSTTNSLGLLTNSLVTEVSFGATQLDTVYAKRSDETPVYLARYGDFQALPRFAWQLRDRRIWNFGESNVATVSVTSKDGARQWVRNPGAGWTNDLVQNAIIEEGLHRLGLLKAVSWVARGEQRLKSFGLAEEAMTFSLEVVRAGKTETLQLAFGKMAPGGNVYAATVLEGDREKTIFVFPSGLYKGLTGALAPRPPDK